MDRPREETALVSVEPAIRWPVRLIVAARALTIGLAYYFVVRLPGLTSSFVAILGALLAFDVYVALEHRTQGVIGFVRALSIAWPRALGTTLHLLMGILVGLAFGLLHLAGLPYVVAAVATAGIAYTLGERTPANISVYVGLIGGLAVFERVAVGTGAGMAVVWHETMRAAFQAITVTVAALAIGIVTGTLCGMFTRLFLPRGFRSRRSEAYSLPEDDREH